ncbi:MAG: DnaJ family domain-containing protein [Burkholderiaceae bacterium]
MNIFDAIAENKIQQAIERGELDFPEMHGRPLEITEDFSIPVEVRMMLRKLSQAKKASREESALLRYWKARAYRSGRQRTITQATAPDRPMSL